MKTVRKKILGIATASLSLALWSCDGIQSSVRPELEPSPVMVASTSGTSLVVAWERNPTSGSVSADIGAGGGVLVMGKHVLWVPENAVSETASFRMIRDVEHPLRVKLTASRAGDNDIGSAGFSTPVYLGISYDDADVPSDESILEAIYFRPDGLVEEVPSTVITSENRIVAKLSHFSMYGVAWP